MKFPIIFIIILIILQFFAYNLARALIWQFNIQHRRARKWLLVAVFTLTDGLLLLSMIRALHLFRWSANLMVLLWFVFMTTAVVFVVGKICQKIPRYQNHADLLQRDLRWFAPVVLVGIFALGLYNAYVPVVQYAQIRINKPFRQPVRIGMAADTHLGVLVGARQLDKLAKIMTENQVDMILLPGDIMDDNTQVYTAENMKPHLQKLRAPLGVYATLGNHDLYGDSADIRRAIEDAGIVVLHDDVLKVDNRFWVVGRPDQTDQQRAQTADLLKKVNTSEAVFLLDHRPDDALAHSQMPIDLQVSGHVHNGQIFPMNLLVRAINDIHYGYREINQSHFVVTSGFGFWGVPFRLASQSEVWIIDVQGQ